MLGAYVAETTILQMVLRPDTVRSVEGEVSFTAVTARVPAGG